MNYLEDIFAEFKKGNAQQRLDLYMQHRELRSDFDQIENEKISTQTHPSHQIVIEPSKANNQQSLFVRMKRWCFAILS